MAFSGEHVVATAAAFARNVTTGSTTSTGYIVTLPTAGVCGVAFVAPPSGKVTVLFRTSGFNSGANDNKTAVRVGTTNVIGGGVEVYAATDNDMILFTGASTYGIGSMVEISGLTAGDVYNACLAHRVGAGTGSFLFRSIKVIPDP
jgi:hypothetical protein